MDLHTPISQAGKLFKMYASRLEKLGIETFGDLLTHFPFRYDNFSIISKILSIQPGEIVTIVGEVTEINTQYLRNRRTIQKAYVSDESGIVEVTWFNQPYITKTIPVGTKVALSGKVGEFRLKKTMENPEYEVVGDQPLIHTGRLVPIYPETRGVSSKWLRRQVNKLLHTTSLPEEYLPQDILLKHNLPSFQDALQQVHFPDTLEHAQRARERLAFDEVFLMQLTSLIRRQQWEKIKVGQELHIEPFKKNIEQFLTSLPFELTNAQKQAVEDILSDFSAHKPMNRLLEGDVGSGKTVVAAISMYVTYLNGLQSVLMAPTEILAHQHFNTINGLLSPFGIEVALATSSTKTHDGKKSFDILIGTHAVLSEKINFKNLAFVVIDEQQRFGVQQRAIIRQKGNNPHLLTMTATPIPRTIALTRYGDLDLSYLRDMPKGRKIIKTWLVPPEKRTSAYEWIEKEVKNTDSQAFIICPFIEESESMTTVKAATKEFQRLQKDVFPKLKLGLLHGKQKAKEKDETLKNFKDKKYDILVATPVVEVGIDIPNATVIVIEAAERFGLAQLHQLRGRVGRGEKQSYCLLFTDSPNPQTKERLKAMETMHVGAELAELDLKLRGPGELYGTMQHGRREFKIAKFSDFDLLQKARVEAQNFINRLDEFPKLKKKISKEEKEVAPD